MHEENGEQVSYLNRWGLGGKRKNGSKGIIGEGIWQGLWWWKENDKGRKKNENKRCLVMCGD